MKKLKKKIIKYFLYFLLYLFVIPPYFIPVDGPVSSHFFVRFWEQKKKLLPKAELHKGLDFAAPRGTLVRSSKSGIVKATGYNSGYGNFVIVQHWFGFSTLYGHLQKIHVKKGDFVFKYFSKIGSVGTTGRSTGPHLHFELRFRGLRVPPYPFLMFHYLRRMVWS